MRPGTAVLIDDRCCSKCDRETYTRGDRGVVREASDRAVLVLVERTRQVVAFSPTEVIAAGPGPAPDAAQLYRCCAHCTCPTRDGHPVPCTGCRQPLITTDDQRVARQMAAGQ